MGKIKLPVRVKLFTGLITNRVIQIPKCERELVSKFGPIDLKSELIDFTHTHYYEKEMGIGLKRKFLSFESLILPDKIVNIKLFTNKLEKKFQDRDNNRTVNIDPGYITDAKLILATTKDYSHRIYLQKGIYAEVTLCYKDGSFHPWPWTYPDYRTQEYISFFNKVREKYMKQLRQV